VLEVNGISLHVEDHGSGKPVLLLHGWPDSANLWRNQIPFLVANGFRAIAPNLRGFGASERPEGVAAYSLQNAVGDVVGILDGFDIDATDITELVPRQPRAAHAGTLAHSSAGGSTDARRLVHKRLLPRRRTDEDFGSLRQRALALRADRWRQPLDPARRI
jgi:alpha/beta hydrolase fold